MSQKQWKSLLSDSIWQAKLILPVSAHVAKQHFPRLLCARGNWLPSNFDFCLCWRENEYSPQILIIEEYINTSLWKSVNSEFNSGFFWDKSSVLEGSGIKSSLFLRMNYWYKINTFLLACLSKTFLGWSMIWGWNISFSSLCYFFWFILFPEIVCLQFYKLFCCFPFYFITFKKSSPKDIFIDF